MSINRITGLYPETLSLKAFGCDKSIPVRMTGVTRNEPMEVDDDDDDDEATAPWVQGYK